MSEEELRRLKTMESNINKTDRIQEQALRHLFRNNTDCYADTWEFNNTTGDHIEGRVIQAMTEEKFVELLTKAANLTNKNNLLGIAIVIKGKAEPLSCCICNGDGCSSFDMGTPCESCGGTGKAK